jgi:peroxiredoxin
LEQLVNSKIAGALALISMTILALGQTTAPTTRPSTVGKIVASATDVVPLDKGAKLPKLTLKSADGKPYDLNAAVAQKPTVLIFYRGEWCTICMRQLRGLQGILEELTNAGYQLLAVSPDKPEELVITIDKVQLTYTLLSDSDASAIQAFGLPFEAASTQFKTLERYSGATHHALPIPAVFILGTDGTIKFAHFDPDFKVRINPSELLEQAKAALPK